ncbi:MAG: threonine--tRNA ligase [Chlamydiia bacterium]|nr:threonine--tRNA ligase [Chlamydiia bacterium]
MIHIKLKKGIVHEIEAGSSALDLACKLGLIAPHQAIGVKINDELVDFAFPLKEGDVVHFLDFDDEEGKYIYWHSSAHILAQAVLRLWPDAKPTIGPPIEQGFYYDFADLHISDEDFEAIEKEMQTIIKENYKTQRKVLRNKKEALVAFENNKYKRELIEGFEEDAPITAYQQGEFVDLCRGPHMPNLGKVKALKVLKTSGAYWRGDATREMLTRIYAITFPDRQRLKSFLVCLEEAKKRDHRLIGQKLDFFSLKEEGPGMPFIHPKGMIIWNALLDYWRECHDKAGYVEIKTPVMLSKELWIRSGHWQNYRQNMYTSEIEERAFAIKPMNCPGGMLYYKTKMHSYREFPLRVAEIGHVHRHEASGALSGLFRVRSFHQDDAHIYFTPEQMEDEILRVINLADEIYATFGLNYHLELSTRPEKETIGTDEEWERATTALKRALDRTERPYIINEGDGAFYGPKIDLHIKDAIGRSWQCGTIQLDMALPIAFDLEYVTVDGSRSRPIMIHRALYGSIERFFGVLIEHFAGKFPLWMSPRQVRLLPVADRHVEYAKKVSEHLETLKFHVEIDDSHESVSKKVRNAQLEQVNYMLTVGDRELEKQTITLRTRDNVVRGEMEVAAFIIKIEKERRERSLTSSFSKDG